MAVTPTNTDNRHSAVWDDADTAEDTVSMEDTTEFDDTFDGSTWLASMLYPTGWRLNTLLDTVLVWQSTPTADA